MAIRFRHRGKVTSLSYEQARSALGLQIPHYRNLFNVGKYSLIRATGRRAGSGALSDIARQNAQATNVAGVRTWNSLGRFVKRGEKGIFILAPMIGHKKTDEATESTADAKDATAHLYGFRAVYVFDVSQTEGKDLPTLTDVQGDVNGYKERLFDFVKSQGIELNYSERIAPAKGLSHGGKITLLTGMQPAEEFSTLAHEIAHELLHRGERRTLTTKEVRETEAEAVA
jgi:hypothetical protein